MSDSAPLSDNVLQLDENISTGFGDFVFSAPVVSLGEEESKPQEEPEKKEPKVRDFKITIKRDPFFTGFDITSEEEAEKRRQRAAKFGVPLYNPVAEMQQLDYEEYERREARKQKFGMQEPDPASFMDMDNENDERELVSLAAKQRWEAVHLYGTKLLQDRMSTRDVLAYFQEYGPVHVEWISDSRCNVVFGDEFSGKRALVGLSKLLDYEVSATDEELQQHGLSRDDLKYLSWRIGKEHTPDSTILMRIANDKDVKREYKPSEYYKLVGHRRRKASNKPRAPKSISLRGGEAKESAAAKQDEEGDVSMGTGKVRKERGGRKLRKQKANPYSRSDGEAESTPEGDLAANTESQASRQRKAEKTRLQHYRAPRGSIQASAIEESEEAKVRRQQRFASGPAASVSTSSAVSSTSGVEGDSLSTASDHELLATTDGEAVISLEGQENL